MAIQFLERDLEDIIFNAPQDKLQERGLDIAYDVIKRQVNLGSYGIADMVTFDYFNLETFGEKSLIITVYELKKGNINVQALMQAAKYVKGIQRILERTLNIKNTRIEYKICLVGCELDYSGGFLLLTDLIDCLEMYTYRYDFDGISFEFRNEFINSIENMPDGISDYAKDIFSTLIDQTNGRRK